MSTSASARAFPFLSLPLFLELGGTAKLSGNDTLRPVASEYKRDGPASDDGDGRTNSTPPMPPDEGMRSRVRKPRSMPTRGPKSIGLSPVCSGLPRAFVELFSFTNWDGGEGEGVRGVWFSTNSVMRVRTQSRALAPQAHVVKVEERVWSIVVNWLRMCCRWWGLRKALRMSVSSGEKKRSTHENVNGL